MVLVSFPFAAGVALSQFCRFPLFHICLALSAVLILLALADALPRKPWFALLFLVLGALRFVWIPGRNRGGKRRSRSLRYPDPPYPLARQPELRTRARTAHGP